MASNTHLIHDPVELGELERDILTTVWRLGSVTAEQVREELDRPLKDSTHSHRPSPPRRKGLPRSRD